MPDDEKKLRIKIKSVQRLVKERDHYTREIEEIRNGLSKLKEHDPDDYDIKKKEEILEETIITRETTKQLVTKFTEELKKHIVPYLETGDLSEEIIDEINSIE
jgi:uncharacterized protein with NAD-binding domain and iron-sulfur cluster